MYTPHVVTLYNVSEDPISLEVSYNITILDGVFLDRAQAANIEKSGLRDADSASLFIPFSVHAYEPRELTPERAYVGEATVGVAVVGVTERRKTYIPPKAYRNLQDKTGYWTIEAGGVSSGVDCFFVKGVMVSMEGYRMIREYYDDVFDVTTVDTRDFGSADMQHWQVGAR